MMSATMATATKAFSCASEGVGLYTVRKVREEKWKKRLNECKPLSGLLEGGVKWKGEGQGEEGGVNEVPVAASARSLDPDWLIDSECSALTSAAVRQQAVSGRWLPGDE